MDDKEHGDDDDDDGDENHDDGDDDENAALRNAHLSANSASDVNTTFLPLHLWNASFIFCIEKFNTEEFQIVEILFRTLLSFNATGPQSFTMVGRHT